VNKEYLHPNLRIRITEYYKIKVVSVDSINKTIKLSSDILVVIPLDTILRFSSGEIRLTTESLIPDWDTGSLDHSYELATGSLPSTGDCTSFNDPITGQLRQYEQATILECSVRRIKEPVPESLAGVDHNALRLRGRLLTEYDRVIKPGLYDAETEFNVGQKSVGKMLLENNVSDSIQGHEDLLGKKISGWFQSYLIKQS
jgi:hypothetical protein